MKKDMHCLKICIFFTFLTLIKVGAEVIGKDDSHEVSALSPTTLPIALQLSKSTQMVVEHEIDKSNEHTKYQGTMNDVEVFKDKLGSHMEKQDEDPEAEAADEEAQPDAEEAKPEEEGEAEAEAEPEAEPAAEAEAEEVAEPEAEPPAEEEPNPEEPKDEEEAPTAPEAEEETVQEPEPEPEPEPAPEPAAEEEKEDTPPETPPQPEETANTDEAAVANDESEMPNDEPAKDEEQDKKDVDNVAEDEKTKTTAAKDHDDTEVSCFTCTSVEDLNCHIKATQQVPCPKVNEGDAGKHNGCYTLYQADTNTTMRGCVDELAEEGLKYCLTNEKLCNLCYKNGCNNKVAPKSNANLLQFNLYPMLFINMFAIITIKKLTNVSLI